MSGRWHRGVSIRTGGEPCRAPTLKSIVPRPPQRPLFSLNEAGGHGVLEKHTDLLHINLMYKFIVASERLHLVYSPRLQRQPRNRLLLGFILTTFLYTSTSVFVTSIKMNLQNCSLNDSYTWCLLFPSPTAISVWIKNCIFHAGSSRLLVLRTSTLITESVSASTGFSFL